MMTAKKLIVTAALLVGASLGMTTAGLAQAYYEGPAAQGYYGEPAGQGYYGGPYGQGYYDYAPGPGFAPSYDNYGPSASDCERGGPGPRVGCGSGMGIGSQR